jgi:general secretion pathway protein A
MLARPELRQLAQRIVARYHLGPLTRQELDAYVRHRLEVAGTQRPLFAASLMGRLHRLSGGVPRIVNVLCDRALLGTFVQGRERVDRRTLDKAAREILPLPATRRRVVWGVLAAGLILLAGGAVGVALYQRDPPKREVATALPATGKTAKGRVASAGAAAALEWPSGAPLSRSEAMAYAALFRAWDADYQGGDACRKAEELGLRCWTARGGLDELRELNQPAALPMRDDQGRLFHATLIGLGPDTATFAVGGETRTVSLGALAAQWSGDYTLLWRPPAAVQGKLRMGDRGPAVAWLIGQLAQTRGVAPEADREPVFDEALMREVKQFQLDRGLVPDGTAGARTLIRLVGETDKAAPKLVATPPEQEVKI